MTTAVIQHATFAEALAAAQLEFPPIIKDQEATVKSERTGGTYKYKYAELSQILNKIRPALNAHGIAVQLRTTVHGDKSYIGTVLRWKSEEYSSAGLPLSTNLDPQKLGGQMKYYERYDLSAFVGISTEDDTDLSETMPTSVRRTAKREGTVGGSVTPPAAGPKPTAVIAPDVMKGFTTRLRALADVTGAQALSKYLKTSANVTASNQITQSQYEVILGGLEHAKSQGDKYLVALVNGD